MNPFAPPSASNPFSPGAPHVGPASAAREQAASALSVHAPPSGGAGNPFSPRRTLSAQANVQSQPHPVAATDRGMKTRDTLHDPHPLERDSVDRTGTYKPSWVPNTPACQVCGATFSLTFRRHHCRCCGACVCDGCSDHKWLLDWQRRRRAASSGSGDSLLTRVQKRRAMSRGTVAAIREADTPSRVCDPCFASLAGQELRNAERLAEIAERRHDAERRALRKELDALHDHVRRTQLERETALRRAFEAKIEGLRRRLNADLSKAAAEFSYELSRSRAEAESRRGPRLASLAKESQQARALAQELRSQLGSGLRSETDATAALASAARVRLSLRHTLAGAAAAGGGVGPAGAAPAGPASGRRNPALRSGNARSAPAGLARAPDPGRPRRGRSRSWSGGRLPLAVTRASSASGARRLGLPAADGRRPAADSDATVQRPRSASETTLQDMFGF